MSSAEIFTSPLPQNSVDWLAVMQVYTYDMYVEW